MAEGMSMSVMAGSDEVNDERLSIADNDEASNDGDNQTRNTQQRHGYCTRRCKILCLVVVSVIAAVVAAVLIPRYLVNLCSFYINRSNSVFLFSKLYLISYF